MREALRLIPKEFRRRGIVVVLGGFVRALLNFIGIAALLPILYLIIEPEKMLSNAFVNNCYTFFGFQSTSSFVIAVCLVVIGIIIIKNILNILIYRSQTNYFLSLFRYFSKRLFCVYHWRGLMFLKKNNSARLAHEVNFMCMAYVLNVLAAYSAVVVEFVFCVLMFVAMLFVDVKAALLMFAIFVPIAIFQSWYMRNHVKMYGKMENEARWKQQRLVLESFKGYAEIEISNTLPILAERFEYGQKTISKYRRKMELASQVPSALIEICVMLVLVVLILIKAPIVIFGVFAVFALRMLPAVRSVMNGLLQIKNNSYTIDIVARGCSDYDIMNTSVDKRRIEFKHKIEIKNLTFTFDDNVSIIKNFSQTINKGERIGIQGPSGSGKTTLFNIMLGFLQPTIGEILIDGVELNAQTKQSWQNIIGYVPQEVFLMDATIAENIALGAKIDYEKMNNVLKMANLQTFVNTLSKGVDTPVGECGNRLSGGQKQRIGIARALYKNAEVLFFDEATSSLDRETESEINQAIESLSNDNRELTIIVISHHESSLRFCDRIIKIVN